MTQVQSAGRYRLHRRPRSRPAPVPAGEIRIAPPPPVGRTATQGWPMLLPLLSGAGSLPLLLGSPSSGRRWLLLGMAASLLLSTGAGLGLRLLAHRAAERALRRERGRYLAHLQEVGGAAARVAALQRAAGEHLHPDVTALLAVIDAGDRVWERTPGDEDFLEVRLGLGPVGLAAPVHLDLGRDPLADHDPELLAAARDLARRSSRLEVMPVTVSLRRLGVLTIRGRPEAARSLARSLVLPSAAFHAPRDLRVLAVFPPDAAPAWEWLKWLPHCRDGGAATSPGAVPGLGGAPVLPAVPRCLLAATGRQAAELLEREVGPRLAHAVANPLPAGLVPSAAPVGAAHLLVVVDGYAPHGPVGRLPMLDALLRAAPALNATVLCLVERAADEPSATRLRVELDDRGDLIMTEVGQGGHRTGGIRADQPDLTLSEAVARRLAPLWLDDPRGHPTGEAMPWSSRLLGVLGLPEPEALDPSQGWHPRRLPDSLRVPIGQPVSPGTPAGLPGLAPSRQPVVLDIKEAAEGGMGPHGLVVGATGLGKSELLRTVVAGLALTHPPELLAFVLVDFKGGAAFAGLAVLPHTAGLITNLQAEPSMVDRALIALRGELERRQRLLRDAGDLDSIGRYQRLRSADQHLEPLPRLLVVVDEFGELLAAHPEFLDLFTAIGRTGRSLGIHLLLASQRLEEGRLRGLDSHLR
jgi:DNA segregation ATPase FtsK/SpoIIIE, S-DNA-T family